MAQYEEKSHMTNSKIKIKLESKENLGKIIKFISERKASYVKVDSSILSCLQRGESPPVINEDLATLAEWQAIIESRMDFYSRDTVYAHAHVARLLRNRLEPKNKDLYLPLLAEYEYSCGEIEKAIELYNSIGNGDHVARVTELQNKLNEKFSVSKDDSLEDENTQVKVNNLLESENSQVKVKEGGNKSNQPKKRNKNRKKISEKGKGQTSS